MKKIIKAISIFHQGERIVIQVTRAGRFRVPVTEMINGSIKTRVKNLTAREVINHEVIKGCDPTLYLDDGKRLRVFINGDPSYLPAEVDGILEKHDSTNGKKPPLSRKQRLENSRAEYYSSRGDYANIALDMYGVWPTAEDYEAD